MRLSPAFSASIRDDSGESAYAAHLFTYVPGRLPFPTSDTAELPLHAAPVLVLPLFRVPYLPLLHISRQLIHQCLRAKVLLFAGLLPEDSAVCSLIVLGGLTLFVLEKGTPDTCGGTYRLMFGQRRIQCCMGSVGIT